MARITSHLKRANKDVQKALSRPPGTEDQPSLRRRELPPLDAVVLDEQADETRLHRKAQEFATLDVCGSNGKVYRITVPASYAPNIPKVWHWDTRKMKAAELISIGIPVAKVVEDPEVGISSRHIIYAWLQHPEFREQIDGMVMETGFASQRERIAGLSRMTQRIFDRLLDNVEVIPITEKSVGPLMSGILAGMKQLAQEKGEFIEQQNVTQQTTLDGKITTASMDVGELLNSKSAEDRASLEAEFDKIGDEIIRNLTGGGATGG